MKKVKAFILDKYGYRFKDELLVEVTVNELYEELNMTKREPNTIINWAIKKGFCKAARGLLYGYPFWTFEEIK